MHGLTVPVLCAVYAHPGVIIYIGASALVCVVMLYIFRHEVDEADEDKNADKGENEEATAPIVQR
jgi:hypothetical protein